MKTLDTQFDKNGFHFEQIKRSGPWALFRKTRQGVDGLIENFEVVKPNVHKAGERYGKHYPERETYPTDRDWGIKGFICQNEDDARDALKSKAGIGVEGDA